MQPTARPVPQARAIRAASQDAAARADGGEDDRRALKLHLGFQPVLGDVACFGDAFDDDPGLHRKITIEKSGSQTTVVWNPWIAKAAAMADFGDNEWPGMLCVETANAGANAITLGPGKTHSTRAIISVA